MKQDVFVFESATFNSKTGVIELSYSLNGETQFVETLELPQKAPIAGDTNPVVLRALKNLHLAGGVSYYKTTCAKKIETKFDLCEEEATFWNTVYTKGLGEFFYHNDIDFRGLISFPTGKTAHNSPIGTRKQEHIQHDALVPIGGGKDSLVTIEKLKEEGKDITLLRIGSHPHIDALVQELGLPCITVTRKLSPELFAMNAEGAYNGHVPITAYLSFLAVLLAEVYGFAEVVLSSEQSASEGNVEYLGEEINHQWSKSAEFETMFQQHVRSFIDPSMRYSNPLRGMTELEIVKECIQYPQYFHLFTSCNVNWKILGKKTEERWCKQCPKCAFVFALFAAYLPKETLIDIFGSNLYDDTSLIPLYKQLLGIEGFKPFECVGTAAETNDAFHLAHGRGDLDDTPVMNMFLESE